ncbi:SH3 domain-containing protein [Mesorhizobium sp. VNQ89]|uniref:SH3 domain-containing protein n=1 Tax=Mesorhizobium quangtriensis TaxID=3157709 RepID=UPI0032B73E24
MKSPLKIGAVRAPKNRLLFNADRIESGKARRIASLSAAGAIVVGVAAGSAFFVDYLADRALARTVDVPANGKPVVTASVAAKASVAATASVDATSTVASVAAAPALPAGAVVQPQAEPIEATLPDAEAIAKVAAVGPEHAIEVPTDDPTGDPLLAYADEGSGDGAFAEGTGEDDTMTSAISPEEVAPAPKPKKKVAKAKPAAVEKQTEIASLPGVNVGGLAGHPSDDNDTSGSKVKTTVKTAGAVSGTGRIKSAVNMRTSPKKGASVLGVVPAGASVNVRSCDQWCNITWNGKSGWVYKTFLAASKG